MNTNWRKVGPPPLYLYFSNYFIYLDQTFFITNTLFNGRVPSKTLYVLVEQDQHLGSFGKNPAYLNHYSLSKFSQKINSIDSPLPMEMEWEGAKNIDIP